MIFPWTATHMHSGKPQIDISDVQCSVFQRMFCLFKVCVSCWHILSQPVPTPDSSSTNIGQDPSAPEIDESSVAATGFN